MNYQFNPPSPYAELDKPQVIEPQPVETQEESHFSALLEKKIVLPSAKKIAPLVDETVSETEITDPVALRLIDNLYREVIQTLPVPESPFPVCALCGRRHPQQY